MDVTESDAAERAAGGGELQTSESQLERMRERLAEETKKRESAEQERDSERRRVLSERSNRFAAQEQAVASALENARTRLSELKRGYAQRMAEGQFAEGVELQEQMAEAMLEIRGLGWQQQQFHEARRGEPQDPRARFEQAIGALPAEAQDWCRRHPDFVTDARRNAEAQAAHFAAVAEGLREWSPDYWAFVEGRLGLGEAPEEEAEESAAAAPAARRAAEPRRVGASTAAPPSRGGANFTGEPRRRTRQPSAGELEAAKISFPEEWKESPKKALELYFENQAALRREGRL